MESSASKPAARMTRSAKKKFPIRTTSDPWSSKTPEKPMPAQQRGRNRGVALSVKDIRREAQRLRESDPAPQTHLDKTKLEPRSTKRRILSSPNPKSKVAAEPGSTLKLPPMFEKLCETFNSLDSVMRLSRMKGLATVFSNIAPKVESLTDRRFTYEQLAQLKFILPEGIVLKKVLTKDERTSCMKPDLHISFETDAVETDKKVKGGGGGNLQLRKVFRTRLMDFYKSKPEGTEIPEGLLPEPFGQPVEAFLTSFDTVNSPANSEPAPESLLEEKKTVANPLSEEKKITSHLSHSFRKRFSRKMSGNVEVSTDFHPTSEHAVVKSNLGICSFSDVGDAHVAPSPMETSYCESDDEFNAPSCSVSSSLPATPYKLTTSLDSKCCFETPSKPAPIPLSPAVATPASFTPKRSLMSPDDDSSMAANKLARQAVRTTKSLNFDSPVKNVDSELADILDADLLQSIIEKERKAREENDPAISQAKRRRDLIACQPKLFDMVRFYFQSIKRSVVTKEEFLHSVISSHSDIVDKRELEDQLKLLQELAPEYISENIASSGDCLLRVNKISNAESIRAKLAEAI